MNNNATLNQMKEMRLLGMFNAFEALLRAGQTPALTHDELVAHLVEAELNDEVTDEANDESSEVNDDERTDDSDEADEEKKDEAKE